MFAASVLLFAPPPTGADFAEVETRSEAQVRSAIMRDVRINSGADFANDAAREEGIDHTSDAPSDDHSDANGDADGDADGVAHDDAHEDDSHDYPEARLYDATIDASAAVDEALARAEVSKRNVLIVLGANWCHDSRAFAGWTATPHIGGMIAERFELVFVNVGMPQTGDGHNQHIARRFGFDKQEGTPLVIMTSYDGIVLNSETAQGWRNTASRSEDEIYEELALMATTEIARD